MDLSSILPMLMGSMGSGGDKSSQMASILSAMNGGGSTPVNAENSGAPNPANNIASLLQGQNSQSGGGGLDPAAIMSMLSNRNKGGGGGTNMGGLDIVNLMSMMNNNKKPKRNASGFKPIKDIAPNDIMGIMIKMFT